MQTNESVNPYKYREEGRKTTETSVVLNFGFVYFRLPLAEGVNSDMLVKATTPKQINDRSAYAFSHISVFFLVFVLNKL